MVNCYSGIDRTRRTHEQSDVGVIVVDVTRRRPATDWPTFLRDEIADTFATVDNDKLISRIAQLPTVIVANKCDQLSPDGLDSMPATVSVYDVDNVPVVMVSSIARDRSSFRRHRASTIVWALSRSRAPSPR